MIPEVNLMLMEAGIEMTRTTIHKYSNSIMQRSILMTKMSPSDYSDRRKWAHKIKE